MNDCSIWFINDYTICVLQHARQRNLGWILYFCLVFDKSSITLILLKMRSFFFFYVIWWFSFFAEFLMLRLYLDLSIVFRRTRIKVFMELNKHNYFFFLFSLKIVVHRQSANVICIYVILSFLCIRIHAQIRACCIRCVCRTCLSYIYLNLRVQ